jgi:3-isopropylmalate/(R)-2-methylmalate dehydratase small subunit
MEAFQPFTGTAVAFMQPNINTDAILPGEWMMRVYREGFAQGLFADQRYLAGGSLNPDFILNREPWSHARILLADSNFGCGSTREEAPLALYHFGFRCLIAPSFPSVFFANCFRNGILPIELPHAEVAQLAEETGQSAGAAAFSVDLEHRFVVSPRRGRISFSSPRRLSEMLLKGLDEIGLTQTHAREIEGYRAQDRLSRDWLYTTTP